MENVLNLKLPGTVDLGEKELKRVNGGNAAIVFVFGALVGGAIYDVYKWTCTKIAKWHINNPGYYTHKHK